MRPLAVVAASLAGLVLLVAFFVTWPEVVFDLDKEAVGSSLNDELGSNTIYGCSNRGSGTFLCAIGEVGSGACCSVKVKVGEDRCWESLPGRRGRNPELSGCIGLFDYLFDDRPSFNE